MTDPAAPPDPTSEDLAALPPLGRSRQIMDALARYIKTRNLQPGDRLPPELLAQLVDLQTRLAD